jgi:hypothetical protein
MFNKLNLNMFGKGDPTDYGFDYGASAETINQYKIDNEELKKSKGTFSENSWYVYGYPYGYGWKLHVSPKPQYCKRIFDIVKNYCVPRKIAFKRTSTLEAYIKIASDSSQVGKFICIYPNTDTISAQTAEDLHQIFKNNGFGEECFVKVKYDFEVYPGIYTRLVGSYDKDYDSNARTSIGISTIEFYNYLHNRISDEITKPIFEYKDKIEKLSIEEDKNKDEINELNMRINALEERKKEFNVTKYKHPFEEIKILGVKMPKLVCDINIVILYCFTKYAIMTYMSGLKNSPKNVKVYFGYYFNNLYTTRLKKFAKIYEINDKDIDVDFNIYSAEAVMPNDYTAWEIAFKQLKLPKPIIEDDIDIDRIEDIYVSYEFPEPNQMIDCYKQNSKHNQHYYPSPLVYLDNTWAELTGYDYNEVKRYINDTWNDELEPGWTQELKDAYNNYITTDWTPELDKKYQKYVDFNWYIKQ